MEYDIQIEELEKSFAEVKAVSGFSLKVRRGELFGLIGPDGAGKTTLIRMLVGLIKPDAGKVLVGGFNVTDELFRIKEIIGYLSQRFSLYPDLTVQENIRFYGDLFGVPPRLQKEKEKQLLAFSRLAPFAKRRASALSGGMKQKLALCSSLIHTPRILFLDEPTTGVDPISRREFWGLLSRLQKEGTTIFISTAYMDEAARCDRVGLMFSGKLMVVESPEKIPQGYPYNLLEVRIEEPVEKAGMLERLPQVRSVQVFGDRLHLAVDRVEEAEESIKGTLTSHGVPSFELREIAPGLEDVFVELIS